MTDAIRPLIAGNWKMNGLKSSVAEFEAMLAGAPALGRESRFAGLPARDADRWFCRQGPRLESSWSGPRIAIPRPSGAHTGDLSAEMLADAGARAIIVGHSERRADHGESDALVRQKAEAAWRAGLTAIVSHRRDPGSSAMPARRSISVAGSLRVRCRTGRPSANLVVAYEPVWAIGTGLTPTRERCRGSTSVYPGRLDRSVWRGRRPDPNSLWRLGQALERRRIDGGRQRQRRPGRRRQPESGRFPCYCGRLSLAKPRWYRGGNGRPDRVTPRNFRKTRKAQAAAGTGAAGL